MFSPSNRFLSIIVPAYNSEPSVPELVRRLAQVLPTLASQYELIIVNDGSRDNTWQVICEASAKYAWIRGIDLMRNYGQHNALLCGIRAAHGEILVTMDDDLQNPPEVIATLIDHLETGFDVVYGTPAREQHGLWRDAASRMTKFALQSAMGEQTARYVSAFRAIRVETRNAFAGYQGSYVSIDVLLTWATARFGWIRVPHEERKFGTSNYTLSKLMTHATNMLTGYSTLPLRLASMLGFAFTVFGFGLLVYVLARFITFGGIVPGFAFLASTVSVFAGVQLFAIGVMGEYLSRMHVRLMDRPTFTVRSDTSIPDASGRQLS